MNKITSACTLILCFSEIRLYLHVLSVLGGSKFSHSQRIAPLFPPLQLRQWRNSRSGRWLPRSRRSFAHAAGATHTSRCFFAHRILNMAALLSLPAHHNGDNFLTFATQPLLGFVLVFYAVLSFPHHSLLVTHNFLSFTHPLYLVPFLYPISPFVP